MSDKTSLIDQLPVEHPSASTQHAAECHREAKIRCSNALREETTAEDRIAVFETWGELYYNRFGRLCPGKSEPMAMNLDSGDAENRAQYEAWHSTGLSKADAIREVVRLNAQVKALHQQIEDAEPVANEVASGNAVGNTDCCCGKADELDGWPVWHGGYRPALEPTDEA